LRAFGFQTHALRSGAQQSPTAFIAARSETERERYGVRTVARPTLEAASMVRAGQPPAGRALCAA
jgi:hypothetical protein